jgi:hypothetical protein
MPWQEFEDRPDWEGEVRMRQWMRAEELPPYYVLRRQRRRRFWLLVLLLLGVALLAKTCSV